MSDDAPTTSVAGRRASRPAGQIDPQLLSPHTVAVLAGLRLTTRRRVAGRFAGGHRSRRYGSSLEFADYREYAPGDDPRRVDVAAYRRLGRLLVKLTEAEDEAPVRIVVDQSASMGFGRKAPRARELAAALTVLGAGGQDPVRVLLAGSADDAGAVVPGPWLRGRQALPAVTRHLIANAAPAADLGRALASDDPGLTSRSDPTAEVAGTAAGAVADGAGAHGALVSALRRAHGEGARGPVVLVSDLLFEGFGEVLRALAGPGERGRGGDAVLVHLVGREDLDPSIRGDLRLVDAETGRDVEVAIDDEGLEAYLAARDAWIDEVDAIAGRHGIAVVRTVDDADLEQVLLHDFRAAGVVA